jgi:hypothetical protein
VTDMTPTGFTVQAKGGTGDSTFSWRIVAKRKDIAGQRLETVTVPPEPTLPRPVADVATEAPLDARSRVRR